MAGGWISGRGRVPHPRAVYLSQENQYWLGQGQFLLHQTGPGIEQIYVEDVLYFSMILCYFYAQRKFWDLMKAMVFYGL